MNTEIAFRHLVENPYYWQATGESKNLRRYYLYRIRHRRPILIDTQIDLLKRAGFQVRTEMTWLV